jgi:predicted nucleic acid-binding protein
MAATECYLDTSALIKLYVPEAFSSAVEDFLAGEAQPVISRLSVLEWHCAMARRQRTGSIPASYLTAAREEFTRHLAEGYFLVQPFGDAQFISAQAILNRTNPVPLRTLDALHLAATHDAKLERLATADKIMADAAQQLGITVHAFFA